MSLYTQWNELMDGENSAQKSAVYKRYIDHETLIYEQLLGDYKTVPKGTFRDFVAQFNTDELVFTGFLDGISGSLKNELNLEELTEDTEIVLDIDFNKLYFNMLKAKAKWLYNMESWEQILDQEMRNQILADFRATIIVKSEKIGRNEPCPCGSGKKYKNCCYNQD